MSRDTLDTATLADPLAPTLGFQLRRTAAAAATALTRALEPLGLRVGEAYLLHTIGANPGCTQSAIARAHRMQPANLVPMIARLESIGVLDRTPGRGRAIGLALSDEGRVLAERVADLLGRHEARLTATLTAEEQAALTATLARVVRNACSSD